MNPRLGTNSLHSLHVQSVGFQFFILVLNSFKDLDSLMFGGIISHIFDPRYLMVSVP